MQDRRQEGRGRGRRQGRRKEADDGKVDGNIADGNADGKAAWVSRLSPPFCAPAILAPSFPHHTVRDPRWPSKSAHQFVRPPPAISLAECLGIDRPASFDAARVSSRVCLCADFCRLGGGSARQLNSTARLGGSAWRLGVAVRLGYTAAQLGSAAVARRRSGRSVGAAWLGCSAA